MQLTRIAAISLLFVSAPVIQAQQAAPDTVWRQDTRPPVWGASPRALAPRLRIGDGGSAISFGKISRLVVGPNGDVVVLDRSPEARPITVFSRDGRVKASFGSFGEGPAEFTTVATVAFSGRDTLVISDSRLARISVWSSAGTHLYDIPLRDVMPGAQLPSISSGPSGMVWLSEQVHPGSPNPREALRSHIPVRFHLLDLGRRARSTPGSESSLQGLIPKVPFGSRVFRVPTVAGKVVTVESARVGMASMADGGTQVRGTWVEVPQIAVLAAERAEQDHLNATVREYGLPMARPPVVSVPRYKDPVSDADAGSDGRIWIRLATVGVLGEPVMGFRTNYSPVEAYIRYHDRFRYAAFEPDGRFLGIVELPGNYSRVEFGPGTIWAVEADADGIESLVRFDVPGS